jgi:hypothetical protein
VNQVVQVAQDMDLLHLLNETELAQLIRRQTGVVIARSVGRDCMLDILENNWIPDPNVFLDGQGEIPSEVSKTDESRKKLQLYIEKNWNGIQSQLPCKGENRGRCTVYPCPEARHVDCLLAAGPHLKVHGLQT